MKKNRNGKGVSVSEVKKRLDCISEKLKKLSEKMPSSTKTK